ncbi:iron chelate uptake ABC transporter, FeCT family, permease protein [Paenibacillus sp. oral taxon 786 str. D14]|nr:iron chelate uptake ABC transporter, FeCT family, permease protein [Paenibacillus sp. oral taxon 786 str. D14]
MSYYHIYDNDSHYHDHRFMGGEILNTTAANQKMGSLYYLLILLLIVLIGVSAVYSVSIGQVHIPFKQAITIMLNFLSHGRWGSLEHIDNQSYLNIILQVRMPRVIFALLIGMGLALCGAVMQAVVQNPLADPYILGISSGASLGATFAILIGFGSGALLSQFGVACETLGDQDRKKRNRQKCFDPRQKQAVCWTDRPQWMRKIDVAKKHLQELGPAERHRFSE